MEKAIGVFDSGVGGLTVVKALFLELPQEEVIYFGDTARVPYGIKSPETVKRFALQNARFLATFDIKLLVVACNTASALALDEVRASFDFPVIGVIEPGCEAAVGATRNGKVGVIGTPATIASSAYERTLKALDGSVEVYSKACPLFVPLAEEGWVDKDVTRMVAEEYLNPLKEAGVDTLILGCTHYPLLKGVIGEVMGEEVTLIDSAEITARKVHEVLRQKDMLAKGGRVHHKFFVSDIPVKFKDVASLFLGRDIDDALEKIDIEKY